MKYAIYIILLFASIFGTNETQAQSNNPKLDKFLSKAMKKSDRIGMQAAYISDGELQWAGSYGIKTYQKEDQINDSTLFMVASLSKPVTALALMKLYDDGKIELDDEIDNYLPFKISNPNHPYVRLTFRMLLSHVSSIRDNWDVLEIGYTIDDGGDSPISLEDFIKSYLTERGEYYNKEKNFLLNAPGTHERYSMVGYVLVGYLVERIANKPFNEYMNEKIFGPLKMNNTYWLLAEVPHDNIATPHNMPYHETDFKGTQVLTNFGYPGYPAGQLRTTVSDYAKFIMLFINNGKVDGEQFLKPETINQFLSIQYPEVAKHRAISWSYNEFENPLYYLLMPRIPSHTGLDPGMSSVVSFDPITKTGAIVISNSPTTTFRSEKVIYLNMVRRLLKEGRKDSKTQK